MRLALIAAASVFACFSLAAQADDDRNQLIVTGEGEVAVEPDMALLSLGVSKEARRAGEAMAEASAALAQVLTSLAEADIPARDIQTTSINLTPIWDHRQPGETPRVRGYTASHMLQVKLRDLGSMGALLDEVVGQGANQLHGLQFTLADPDPARDAARVEAVAEARARAMLLAEAAGLTLGPIIRLSEGAASAPGPVMPLAREMFAAGDVPVAAGEVDIRAAVTLVYEILP